MKSMATGGLAMARRALWATAVAGVLFGVLGVSTASAATAGNAQVVMPDSTTPLASGGSATPFALLLPGDARCAGDSTKRPWYQAGSYLAPKGTNPASINFRYDLPTPGLFLVAFGAPWEKQNVERGTGLVQVPNAFNVQRFLPSDLFPGGTTTSTWEAGVVCTDYQGVVSKYWNVELDFTVHPSDPGGFVWRAVNPPPSSSSGSKWEIGIALVAIGGGGYMILRRLGRQPRDRHAGRTSTPAAPPSP
jgi:hypothetical protein